MPRIHSKTVVLGGKGQVLCYDRDPSTWFYRESNGQGGYRSTKLTATTESDAITQAIDAYTDFRSQEQKHGQVQPKKRAKSKLISTAIDEWLDHEHQKHQSNLIGDSNLHNKQRAAVQLKNYLSHKEVITTLDLTEHTLKDYPIFAGNKKPTTIKAEVGYFNTFLTYLKQQRLIAPDVAVLSLVPKIKVTKEDLQANPAINLHDWRLLHMESKRRMDKYKNDNRLHTSYYWWFTFRSFIFIAKNSGLRPKEMRSLTWKDITVIDAGQRSTKDTRHHYIAEINVRKTKTGEPRQVPCKSGERFLDLKKFQQDYLKGSQAHLNTHKGNYQIKSEDFVFANYTRCNGKVVTLHQYERAWREIREAVKPKLKGHWASDDQYTIYSLRSSFIEDSLMEDIPVHLVAQMTGHDIKILMKHYSQLDVRRKSFELTQLPIGRKKDEERNVVEF